MSKLMLPRLGAACGIVFPIVMFLAVGNGSGFAAWRAIVATWALVLALPFLAYLYSLLRRAEGDGGWLATVALVAGVSGIVLKLGSHAPALALHHHHIAKGTQLYKALDDMGGGATVMSLYPLAICCAAVAAVVVRTGVLPRWLGAFAVVRRYLIRAAPFLTSPTTSHVSLVVITTYTSPGVSSTTSTPANDADTRCCWS